MEETLFSDIPITSSVAVDVIDVAEELSTEEVSGVDITGLKPGDSNTVTIEFDSPTSFVRPDSQFIVAEIDEDSLGKGQDVVEENNFSYTTISSPDTNEQMDLSLEDDPMTEMLGLAYE